MSLTVLSDGDINQLLVDLPKGEIERLQLNLSEALHDYSKGTQDSPGCSTNQPKRLLIPGADGRTTLVMPASTTTSRGIKTVTLQCGGSRVSPAPSMASLNLNKSSSRDSSRSSPTHSPSRADSIASQPSLSHTSTSSSTNVSSAVFSEGRPSVSSPATSSAPSIVSESSAASPRGSMTLLAPNGNPYAFLSAHTLTAFRTALAATTILNKRERVHSITVFGAGLQAKWHIRLALILKGNQIHHVDIINRSFTRAKALMHEYYSDPSWARIRDENPKLQFSIVSDGFKDRDMHVKEHVRKADVIFCCTPSLEPLFPHEILTHADGRRKGRYISAIGSFRPHMQELHPEILRHFVSTHHHTHHHFHKHHPPSESAGVIIVDSLESSLKESGEVIEAGIKPKQLVEIGELMMVKKASMKEIEMGVGEGEKGLKEWLCKGNVVYKSVGLGLMDVCVGEDVVQLAREQGIGKVVEGF